MVKISQNTKVWLLPMIAITFVVVGTIVLVAFAQGYTIDTSNGRITTTGLVLLDSTPNNASIQLNNKDIRKKTPYRYTNAKAGNISIVYKKDQYRDWSATQSVVAGEVTFADYALLLPTILHQEDAIQSEPYGVVVQSIDLRYTVAQAKSSLTIYSISSEGEAKTLYSPPAPASVQKQVVSIEKLQISPNGERILFVQKLANGENQTITIQTRDGKLDNLTTEYGFVFTDLRFSPNNANELFWLEAGEVKKIRITERSISSNLISSVASLEVLSDRLLVVNNPTQTSEITQQLSSYNLSGSDKKDITTLKTDAKGFQTSFIPSRYNEYITVIHNSTGLLEIIKDPYSSQHQTILRQGENTRAVTVSPNSRFLVIDQAKTMSTLDLEYNQKYDFKTNLEGLQRWSWYDNYHIIFMQDQQLRMIDFDGQNNQLLTPIADVSSVSIQSGNKMVLPLNTAGSLYKLWLTKK